MASRSIIYFSILLWISFLQITCQTEKSARTAETVVDRLELPETTGPGQGKKIILVSGDEEYRSEEALPLLARLLVRHGFDCTVLFAQDPDHPGFIQPNYQKNIPGLETLENADLLVLFTRFRALPDSQMVFFEKYLLSGKPVLAIRTATHAFQLKDTSSRYYPWSNSYNNKSSVWDGGFGRLVLGERWFTHHGHHQQQSTRGIFNSQEGQHPILNGIVSGDIWGPTDVYGVRLPLPDSAYTVVWGQVIDRTLPYDAQDPLYGLRPTDTVVAKVNPAAKEPYDPNQPLMPIAWLKKYQLPEGQSGIAFTSTIGAATDLLNEGVRRLLINAAFYLVGQDVPERVDVALDGGYQPSAYAFKSDSFWMAKQLKISDLIRP